MSNPSQELSSYTNKCVSVLTFDGKIIVGLLRGLDANLNVILSDCHERVYSLDDGVQVEQLGLYIIRGDTIAIIGLIDEELDADIDYPNLRAKPLDPIVH